MVTTRRRTRPLADEVTSPVDAETSNVFKLNDELLLSVFDIVRTPRISRVHSNEISYMMRLKLPY